MTVIVRVEGAADGGATPHDGRYVVAWNPHTEFGVLELTSTDDKAQARRFIDVTQALYEWQAISKVQPVRPDIRRNRPLMGITITFERGE
jgi:hypothetical protein